VRSSKHARTSNPRASTRPHTREERRASEKEQVVGAHAPNNTHCALGYGFAASTAAAPKQAGPQAEDDVLTESRTLFVKNLAFATTEEALKRALIQRGFKVPWPTRTCAWEGEPCSCSPK